MPYITRKEREVLDNAIDNIVLVLRCPPNAVCNDNNIDQDLSMLGKINYCFTRVLLELVGNASYSKIAMATGVLENIKQEFYRRLAAEYEDKKILENGDLERYTNAGWQRLPA